MMPDQVATDQVSTDQVSTDQVTQVDRPGHGTGVGWRRSSITSDLDMADDRRHGVGQTSCMDAHRVGAEHVGAVADTLAGAFHDDPVWAWILPDAAARPQQLAAVWTVLLEAAVDHGWIWSTPGTTVATVWIPPGEPELPEPFESRIIALFDDLLDGDTWRIDALGEHFERAHPTGPDHYYLSLFGTHPAHRGRGIGMDLLADNLARVDAEHRPAYLESTNPANLARYRSVGFEDASVFPLADGGPVVTTMWRPAR